MKNKNDILIINYGNDDLTQLKYLLEKSNMSISIVYKSEELNKFLNEHTPDFVILNKFKKNNLIKTSKQLKLGEKTKNTPLIAICNKCNPIDIVSGLESGVDYFISDPETDEHITLRLKNIFENISKNNSIEKNNIKVKFNNKNFTFNLSSVQLIDLLVSEFEKSLEKNNELIKSQSDLTILNEQLEERVEQRTVKLIDEIYERKKAEEELLKYQTKLEQMVEERAMELFKVNKNLMTEIDERKKLEKEQQLLASVIESSPDYIVIADKNRKIIYLNKAAKKLKGIDKLKNNKYSLTDFNSESYKDIILNEAIPYAIENGYWQGSTKTCNSENVEIDLSQILTAHKDSKNNLTFYSTIMRDITKLKEIEKDLEKRTEDFRRVNEELKQFAYTASHDLQEPLRMISSYTKLLAKRYKDKLDENANDYIDFAVDGALRMQKLIDSLLYYSRIGNLNKKFKEIDLNESVENAKFNLSLLINESKAKITSDELPKVIADSSQLNQLFQNLISNALKYKYPDVDTEIHISYKSKKDMYIISIKDNGIGIEQKDHERIFQVFQRLHAKNEYSGTGMGLAICKKIVEYHGGEIWVESELGKGSTFYFSIPKVQKD